MRKGTFRVNKPKSRQSLAQHQLLADATNHQSVKQETSITKTKSASNLPMLATNLQEANKKLRDLNINIRMKEELIKELVANSKFTNRINQQYQHKIESLEKEALRYKSEIGELQQQINELLASGNSGSSANGSGRDHAKIELELRKKVEQYQAKISELEAKHRDNARALNATSNTDKKIGELELALTKMRQQNEVLQRKIKEDGEKKLRLEKDFEKEQQKLKDLETRTDQQQKILKKKTEDLANVKRR